MSEGLSPRFKILVLSGQDFRSKRQVNIHFIARAMMEVGDVRFFSIGFSRLSLIRRDPRANLWASANRIERVDGVECFLWRTPLHPINLARHGAAAAPRALSESLFARYAATPQPVLDQWAREADLIVLESGMAPILMARLRACAPRARFVYVASDALETIGCDAAVERALARHADAFDVIALPSPLLARDFPPGSRLAHIPHGLDARVLGARAAPSPYGPGAHAISVGSMLFDPDFFRIAAAVRPRIRFHVIGAGVPVPAADNIVVYPETPFAETLPFIGHATIGLAPYRQAGAPAYLADTSMKLMQYAALGVPAVCPHFAAGGHAGRFGYRPGDPRSIAAALDAAMAFDATSLRPTYLTWRDVAMRLLHPDQFPEMWIDSAPAAAHG